MSTIRPSSEQTAPTLNLSSADRHFCHQYCAFMESHPDFQRHQDLVSAFRGQETLPANIKYPHSWSIDNSALDQAAASFADLTKGLLPVIIPNEQPQRRSTFKMFNFKSLCWFFAVGFAGNMLLNYTGVKAEPIPQAARIADPTSGSGLFLKGLHHDNTTGQDFHLYVMDDTVDEDSAFDAYMSAYNGSKITKRDWYDCQDFANVNYIQKFCCNTGHGLGAFVLSTGAAAMGGYVSSLMQEAFNGKRDNQSPRSVCLSRNGNNLCVSWAAYDTDKATAGENTDITNYSVQCANSGGSSEFKTTTANNGILYICVSNRADGCVSKVG